jgi:hypothetical protein
MKRLIILLALITIILSGFSQSVKELMDERDKKIENLEYSSMNNKELIKERERIINEYAALIEKAMNPAPPVVSTPTPKVSLGNEVVLKGSNGTFKTKNYKNPVDNANAYAIVSNAIDRSKIIDKIVIDSSGKLDNIDDSYNQVGFEGVFYNRYTDQMVDVFITEVNGGYKKSFTILANSVQYLKLLPGKYKIEVRGEKYWYGENYFDVGPERDFQGLDRKNYYFGAIIGKSRR